MDQYTRKTQRTRVFNPAPKTPIAVATAAIPSKPCTGLKRKFDEALDAKLEEYLARKAGSKKPKFDDKVQQLIRKANTGNVGVSRKVDQSTASIKGQGAVRKGNTLGNAHNSFKKEEEAGRGKHEPPLYGANRVTNNKAIDNRAEQEGSKSRRNFSENRHSSSNHKTDNERESMKDSIIEKSRSHKAQKDHGGSRQNSSHSDVTERKRHHSELNSSAKKDYDKNSFASALGDMSTKVDRIKESTKCHDPSRKEKSGSTKHHSVKKDQDGFANALESISRKGNRPGSSGATVNGSSKVSSERRSNEESIPKSSRKVIVIDIPTAVSQKPIIIKGKRTDQQGKMVAAPKSEKAEKKECVKPVKAKPSKSLRERLASKAKFPLGTATHSNPVLKNMATIKERLAQLTQNKKAVEIVARNQENNIIGKNQEALNNNHITSNKGEQRELKDEPRRLREELPQPVENKGCPQRNVEVVSPVTSTVMDKLHTTNDESSLLPGTGNSSSSGSDESSSSDSGDSSSEDDGASSDDDSDSNNNHISANKGEQSQLKDDSRRLSEELPQLVGNKGCPLQWNGEVVSPVTSTVMNKLHISNDESSLLPGSENSSSSRSDESSSSDSGDSSSEDDGASSDNDSDSSSSEDEEEYDNNEKLGQMLEEKIGRCPNDDEVFRGQLATNGLCQDLDLSCSFSEEEI